MASSLVNDDEDNASSTTTTSGTATTTRNTQQQSQLHSQQQQPNNNNNTNCLKQQQQQTNNNNTSTSDSTANSSKGGSKMHGNEAKAKKESLQQRKLELEKLLNEKNWLLQQLQKQESEILNGNFEYMNFNDFIQNLAIQYKQEQQSKDTVSSIGGASQFSASEESAILRRKPLTAKENQPHHNVLHRRQSEISNRSSEYDNYPQQDNLSTHSEGASSSAVRGGAGGSGSMTMQHAQAQQQYNAKSALKKRSATVAGTTQQSAANLHMIRQHHLDQQLIQDHQQRVQKQQQQQQHMLYKQQHYHHPQQHLFKQHLEHHQVLMPHLQYATQKFYYTTLQPTQPTNTPSSSTQQQQPQPQQQHQPAQPQYGRYIKAQPQQLSQLQSQSQHHHLTQSPQQQLSPNHYNSSSATPTNHHQQSLLMTPPPHGSAVPSHMDNISLYSLNSNNVATLHRQAQQQQPIIVQCDKYYLSPTTHHVSHNDGGGFIKSSQNIKEYISPMNSPQQLMAREREKRLASQTNLSQRGVTATPSIDNISLAPSYVSMETVDYTTSSQQQLQQNQLRWRSQTNLPPSSSANLAMGMNTNELKSYSSDMLNNNQYYNTAINPPPPAANAGSSHALPPNVTQVKPFKPLDEISINSYSTETQKKSKSKQWLESSLDGPVIRQTHHNEDNDYINNNNNSTGQQRSKLSSHSLNTSRHYSMSAATQAKPITSTMASSQNQTTKLSQSTSYLNQIETGVSTTPPSISQAYNVETTSPSHNPMAYKFLPVSNNQKPPARPPLYINATSTTCGSPTTGLLSGVSASSSALSPDIRVESPKNVTVVQPATFQPYKEVTKPFEMSDFYKYSTKYRQKENQAAQQSPDN